jgi:hypothetical protein
MIVFTQAYRVPRNHEAANKQAAQVAAVDITKGREQFGFDVAADVTAIGGGGLYFERTITWTDTDGIFEARYPTPKDQIMAVAGLANAPVDPPTPNAWGFLNATFELGCVTGGKKVTCTTAGL